MGGISFHFVTKGRLLELYIGEVCKNAFWGTKSKHFSRKQDSKIDWEMTAFKTTAASLNFLKILFLKYPQLSVVLFIFHVCFN